MECSLTSVSPASLFLILYVNDAQWAQIAATPNGAYDFASNSFSIFLEQGDKLYFKAVASQDAWASWCLGVVRSSVLI